MDERVKNEYRKIYAELCSLMMLVTAVSLLIKLLILRLALTACVTEYVLLVGGSLYFWIRQTMLGLDPNADETADRRKAKRRFLISFAAGLVGLLLSQVLRNGYDHFPWIELILFVCAFTAAYLISRSFAHWNAEKKARKYEDS